MARTRATPPTRKATRVNKRPVPKTKVKFTTSDHANEKVSFLDKSSKKCETAEQITSSELLGPGMSETVRDESLSETVHDEEYVSSLELLYGKRGIPKTEVELMMSSTPAASGPLHPVRVMKDHILDYPQLWLDVFIAGDRFEEAAFAPMFARSACSRAKSVLESDLVVFTGGSDVDPQLYGEKAHHTTHYSVKRDSEDVSMYMMCLEHGIPMLGICRGAQFLSVMNGGKLYQDVNNHYGDHGMYDLDGKKMINKVSSVHHQMVFPNHNGRMHIIAVSSARSDRRVGPNPLMTETNKAPDIEAFFYRDTCCLGIQGHPEYSGYDTFQRWSLEQVKLHVADNPDVVWDKGSGKLHRRLDPTILLERDTKIITGTKTEVV